MNEVEVRISHPVTAPTARGAAWLFDGFTLFQQEWLTWIGITILFFVLSVVVSILPLGSLLFNFLVFAFVGGLMLGCREIDRGGELSVGHLFTGFSDKLSQYVLLGVIYTVGMAIILLLMGGLLFIMLGGMSFITDLQAGEIDKLIQYSTTILIVVLLALMLYVPLIMAFWFAPALVALGHLSALEAIKLSFSGCMVNVMPFLLYGVVGLILSVLASIPMGLGWLILCPMMVASLYLSYRDIFESGNNQQPTTNN